MPAFLARILPLTTVLTLLIACNPNTQATKPAPTVPYPTATPKASNADLAVGQLCFPMTTGMGTVEDSAVQTVFLSDPNTLTRHVMVSTEVIELVQKIVEQGEPVLKRDTDKLYISCKKWRNADLANAIKVLEEKTNER